MNAPLFKGVITALITPLRDGKVDEAAFTHLLERQIAAGIHGVVPMGIAEGPYTGKPNPHAWMSPEAALGHIHLQVGSVPEADRFYEGVLGLKKMASYPGASFFAAGDYHHHVAANVWNSRNAPARTAAMTGLQYERMVMEGNRSRIVGVSMRHSRSALRTAFFARAPKIEKIHP